MPTQIESGYELMRRVALALPEIDCDIADENERRIGQDEFVFFTAASLEEPDSIPSAANFIAMHASNGRLIFSRNELPRAIEHCGFITDPARKIVGRYITAYDVAEDRFIHRLDFLFKVAPVAAAPSPAPPPAD